MAKKEKRNVVDETLVTLVTQVPAFLAPKGFIKEFVSKENCKNILRMKARSRSFYKTVSVESRSAEFTAMMETFYRRELAKVGQQFTFGK